jgi:hypothetical protein
MKFAGLILARNGLREPPLPRGSTTVGSGRGKAASMQPLYGSDATGAQSFEIKIYMSKEKNHEQAVVFSIEEDAGYLLARQGWLRHQCPFSQARFE